METKLKKNDIITVKIESYTSEGLGVSHYNGITIFISNAIINELHKIIIVKITTSLVYGKSIEIIEKSPYRIEPQCKSFGKCGGCQLQFMSYDEELRFKSKKVLDAVNRIGKVTIDSVCIIPSNKIERYRNKAVFNVYENKIGFYKPRTHELIEVNDCILQSVDAVHIAKQIDTKSLNHISIRDKVCTVYGEKYDGIIPEGLTGLVLCNNNRDNSLLDGTFHTIWGSPEQIETICNKNFIISPQSFFQVNSSTVDALYEKALEYAGYGNTAIELYCGAGTISLCLSERYSKVFALEIVPAAIENAKRNLKLNNINNVEFVCADATKFNDYFSISPDLILVDPPRKGLNETVIKSIIELSPQKIVYISCNPSTLARDILFMSNNYSLSKICAIDMFPRTYHVETVVLMEKRQM